MASVTVDVELDEFDDDEILEAACEIVEGLFNRAELRPGLRKILARLGAALAATDEAPAAPTTAGRLASWRDLQQLVETHPELYRFAAARDDQTTPPTRTPQAPGEGSREAP